MQKHSRTPWNLCGFRILSKPPVDQKVNRSLANPLGGRGAVDTDVRAIKPEHLWHRHQSSMRCLEVGTLEPDQIQWVLWM